MGGVQWGAGLEAPPWKAAEGAGEAPPFYREPCSLLVSHSEFSQSPHPCQLGGPPAGVWLSGKAACPSSRDVKTRPQCNR